MLQQQAEAATAELHAWVEASASRRPTVGDSPRVDWHRGGLSALHHRLEDLKPLDMMISSLLSEAFVRHAHATSWAGICEDQITEKLGPDIERKASTLANKGLAAEERWLSHRMRTLQWWQLQRGFEKYAGLIDATIRSLQVDAYRVRDERLDIRAQFRGIQLAVEIGEL